MANANDKQISGNHYKTKLECWDYIIANDLDYLTGNAVKYLTRWRKKNGLEDLRKAQHYIEKLIETEVASNSGLNQLEYVDDLRAAQIQRAIDSQLPKSVQHCYDVKESWTTHLHDELNTTPILREDTHG